VRRVPRQIPDDRFDELFAQLRSHRDRALVAFWVSTGTRASELLGARAGDADPGTQLITVIRKGTRALQQLPASPDAFVWLRLYRARVQRTSCRKKALVPYTATRSAASGSSAISRSGRGPSCITRASSP
jgi:site-specific recombinase XerC